MRAAHPFHHFPLFALRRAGLGACCALAAAWIPLAHAQTAPLPAHAPPASHTALALDPAAPSRALHHTSLPASGSLVAQPGDWRTANAAVADFPRGHADVLRWEAAQAPHAAAPQPAAVTQAATAPTASSPPPTVPPHAACPMMATMTMGQPGTAAPANPLAGMPAHHRHGGQP